MLHRRVQIAGFAPDPAWSALQQRPDPSLFFKSIRTSRPGKLYWWAVGYDGAGPGARALDGTGGAFNAQIVQARPGRSGSSTEYIRLTSIFETHGSEIEWGRGIVELDWQASEAWVQMISLTPETAATATHLHLSYNFVPQDL